MTEKVSPSGHDDRILCFGRKKGKQRPGAKTGKRPVYDAEGNELCTQPAGWRTDHPGTGRCVLHGGKTPSHKAAAHKEIAERAIRSLGIRDDRPWEDILLDQLAWAAGTVQWLREKVQEIDPDALVWGLSEESHRQAGEFPGIDKTYRAVPNVWLDEYYRAAKELRELIKLAASTELTKNRLEFAQKQLGPQLAVVIRGVVSALDLTPEQELKVPAALAAGYVQLTGSAMDLSGLTAA